MKMQYQILLILLLTVTTYASSYAQSIRFVEKDNQTTRTVIRKTGEKSFEMPPAGVMSYIIDNKQLWGLMSGIKEESGARGSYEKFFDGRVKYYDPHRNLVGYYIPQQGRFMAASAQGETIGKEESYAVLVDGTLTVSAADGVNNYLVDNDMDIEIIGFYLFLL